ncbi:MAG: type II toxin-antitoxin system HicA family toxin [Verrucomicrobiota bacterium]|nr:type II toxin-antitoxin system HicA family toxin [Verrucomicrobiota bacterium]
MKIPRDCSGLELAKALGKFGYTFDRQDGSHIRLTTQRNGELHVTIPNHRSIKVGTLHDILKAVANHHRMTIEELLRELEL